MHILMSNSMVKVVEEWRTIFSGKMWLYFKLPMKFNLSFGAYNFSKDQVGSVSINIVFSVIFYLECGHTLEAKQNKTTTKTKTTKNKQTTKIKQTQQQQKTTKTATTFWSNIL